MRRSRPEIQRAHDRRVGLWVTETGWGSSNGSNPLEVGGSGQAKRLKAMPSVTSSAPAASCRSRPSCGSPGATLRRASAHGVRTRAGQENGQVEARVPHDQAVGALSRTVTVRPGESGNSASWQVPATQLGGHAEGRRLRPGSPSAIAPDALLGGRYRAAPPPRPRRAWRSSGSASTSACERPVAVKILSDTLAGDDVYLQRFRREARVAAGLQHPNLVPIYDFGAGARPYLVMEYVEGGDLGARLRSRRPARAGAAGRAAARRAAPHPRRRASSIATSSPTTCSSTATARRG